jgi:hypothetical protein
MPSTSPKVKVEVMPCQKCEGRGFINIRRFKQVPHGFVSAASVMKNGEPCNCAAGEWFRLQQEEWSKPVPEGRGGSQ